MYTKTYVKDDLIYNLRAIIAECERFGFQVYFLFQVGCFIIVALPIISLHRYVQQQPLEPSSGAYRLDADALSLSKRESYAQVREDDRPMSFEAMRKRLPRDLRSHVELWQEDVLKGFYDRLPPQAWDYAALNGIAWGSGPAVAYLSLVLFMQTNQAYDFAWVVEEDNRLIGDWGVFFAAALYVASTSMNAAVL
jgi:hypothetical protein